MKPAGEADLSCKCSHAVSRSWRTDVRREKIISVAAALRLLAKFREYDVVCFIHMIGLAARLGLATKRTSKKLLAARLETLWDRRLEIGAMKTSNDTYQWFRAGARPMRASDRLGPYKFASASQTETYRFDHAAVLDSWDPTILAEWASEGSITRSVFAWWFEGELGKEILDETDMYRHHLREQNGKKNIGWLRNMFYSISQQLMRQDVVYYMLYTSLRPDHAWRLISYPYYAKYAVPGDGTYFAHMDLNIPELLAKGREVNMIQGTVSLDVEDNDNCTFIMPGVQHKLADWWARVKERGQEADGFVHRITDQMFTKDDAAALGVNWKRVPGRPGDARITLPSLPHGSTGPTTKLRRTLLPWFVAVQEDEELLEVMDGGTWSELAAAHRDFTAAGATPSGLPNRYGAIPFRFPASVELLGLGALSDALVCRRRWSSPAVLAERDILLGDDRKTAEAYISGCRDKALVAARDAYKMMRMEEKRVFGDKSFYYHLERQELYGTPFPDVEQGEARRG